LKPLSRVLVPVDFSSVTPGLLDLAGGVASKYSSQVILFHAIEEGIVEHVAAGYNVADLLPTLERAAREKLPKLAETLRSRGVDVTVFDDMPVADPAVAICNVAREVRASEVMIASKGWGWRRYLTVGSTGRLVVKMCQVPVVYLRATKEDGVVRLLHRGDELFKVILYAYKPGHPEAMVDYLFDLSRKTGAEVVVFYTPEDGESVDKARKEIEDLVSGLSYAGVKAERMILEGKPWNTIASAAEASGATVILMGRTVSKNLSEYILGSTLSRLMSTTRLPLLIYPI